MYGKKENYVEIPSDKLPDLVKKVYAMSKPVGYGFLHFREGDLSDKDTQTLIDHFSDNKNVAVNMDYVHGRQCKMSVYRGDDGSLLVHPYWFDHRHEQLVELLAHIGVEDPEGKIAAAKHREDV